MGDGNGVGPHFAPNGDETAWAYNVYGNLQSITDGEENVTSYIYDAWDRVETESLTVDSQTLTRSFEYDLVGNLKEKTDRNGRVIEFDYDALDRLVTETWLTGGVAVNTIDHTYDLCAPPGNLCQLWS